MAIQYAGGVNRNDLYTGITTRQGILNAINTTLVAAGWTSTQTPAFLWIKHTTGTGQPNNNDTVTFAGVVYTFKTVINNANPREVLIDTTDQLTYDNLRAAINGGAGSGTKYSSATAASTTIRATQHTASRFLRIETQAVGFGANGTTASGSLTNAILSHGQFVGAGYRWQSARTTQGLACVLWGQDCLETANPGVGLVARFIGSNAECQMGITDVAQGAEVNGFGSAASHQFQTDGSAPNDPNNGGYRLGMDVSSSWRIVANRFQVAVSAEGTGATTTTSWVFLAVPFLAPFLVPRAITAASNASPIAITTSGAHGYTTGDNVAIRGILGNLAANGNFTITVTGVSTFTLDGSAGSGAYTSGGFVGKIDLEVAEAVVFNGEGAAGKFIYGNLYAEGLSYWSVLNGFTQLNAAGQASPALFPNVPGDTDFGSAETLWYNTTAYVSEALIGWGTSAAAGQRILGQLYDAVIVRKALTVNITGTFDSHNWINFTNNNVGAINMARGSVLLVIP